MQTPQSSSDGRSTKRMRLGTRSCIDCRRRKVRCIYTGSSKVCGNCEKHHTQCIPQQHSANSEIPADCEHVRDRLQDLEGMVRHICKAIDLDITKTSMSNFEAKVSEALKSLPRPLTPATSRGESDSGRGSPEFEDAFADAPLINLFHCSMMIQPHANDRDGNPQDQPLNHGEAVSYSKAVKPHIPEPHDLVSILHATVDYWEIWGAFPKDLFINGCDRGHKVALAREYIADSLNSEAPCKVARATLILGIAIQQLPLKVKSYTNIPMFSNELIKTYLNTADRLLADEASARTIDGMECLLLQTKIYINMGRPRKAWLSNRRALENAILLRLHNTEWDGNTARKMMWSQVWQADRQLSLLLGVPYSISDCQLRISTKYVGPNDNGSATKILQDLSILAGHINDRNQYDLDEGYPVTLELDQTLQSLKESIPSEWWNVSSSSTMPVHAFYGIQTLKIYVFMIEKILHLPYMLKSSSNPNYLYSRAMALDASRHSIFCYQALRDNPASRTLSCDLTDFLAFSSAITIVIDLLSSGVKSDSLQDNNDWDAIRSVTGTLERVSIDLDCSVAAQATRLLSHLTAIKDGVYSGPEEFEAVVPYFGKVKIYVPLPSEPMPYNVEALGYQVEFGANYFWQSPHFVDPYDSELGIDWSSIVPDQENYDWSQTFELMG